MAANAVLMVEPNTFGFDAQTAKTNSFQKHAGPDAAEVTAAAMKEFAAVRDALREFGVKVFAYAHELGTPRPNAVFPNNWLSTWPDGRVFFYPMATESRRLERVHEVLDGLRGQFEVGEVADISEHEATGRYLESTGAIVFDHVSKVMYGCESPRCDAGLFKQHAQALGYEPILFSAFDHQGVQVYHTNVMMGVQSGTAVLCTEAIRDPDERRRVVDLLEQTGHELVDITLEQMMQYCGNLIQLANARGETCLLVSQSAYDAFTPEQRTVLARDNRLLPVAVPTIQDVGGGSVRCMVAEIFLPSLATASSRASR